MKKRCLFFLVLSMVVLLVASISAEYICSDESKISTDIREINVNSKKNINGLGIAVIGSDEIPALDKIVARLLIGAEKLSLSNETPSENVEIDDDSYTVTLLNATDDLAKIKIGSSSKEIEENSIDSINSLEVYVINSDFSDEGIISSEIIVGIKDITLSNKGVSEQMINVSGLEYLVSLFSASDNEAIIEVSKCESGKLEKINEIILGQNQTSETNSTESNQTNQNKTISESNQTKKSELNKTINNKTDSKTKILPEVASERARERLGELGFEIILKEIPINGENKMIYEAKAKKQGRFLGIFKIIGDLSAEIDAETGEIIKIKKPWWAFLAYGI